MPLNDVEVLHRKRVAADDRKMKTSCSKFLVLQKALRSLGDPRTDRVETGARVLLPFVVETHIVRRTVLGCCDSMGSLHGLEGIGGNVCGKRG